MKYESLLYSTIVIFHLFNLCFTRHSLRDKYGKNHKFSVKGHKRGGHQMLPLNLRLEHRSHDKHAILRKYREKTNRIRDLKKLETGLSTATMEYPLLRKSKKSSSNAKVSRHKKHEGEDKAARLSNHSKDYSTKKKRLSILKRKPQRKTLKNEFGRRYIDPEDTPHNLIKPKIVKYSATRQNSKAETRHSKITSYPWKYLHPSKKSKSIVNHKKLPKRKSVATRHKDLGNEKLLRASHGMAKDIMRRNCSSYGHGTIKNTASRKYERRRKYYGPSTNSRDKYPNKRKTYPTAAATLNPTATDTLNPTTDNYKRNLNYDNLRKSKKNYPESDETSNVEVTTQLIARLLDLLEQYRLNRDSQQLHTAINPNEVISAENVNNRRTTGNKATDENSKKHDSARDDSGPDMPENEHDQPSLEDSGTALDINSLSTTSVEDELLTSGLDEPTADDENHEDEDDEYDKNYHLYHDDTSETSGTEQHSSDLPPEMDSGVLNAGTESSVVATESSVVETENSVVETESSVAETENNVAEAESSVVETESSVVETENSVVETESSVVETESSVVETESLKTEKGSDENQDINNDSKQQSSEAASLTTIISDTEEHVDVDIDIEDTISLSTTTHKTVAEKQDWNKDINQNVFGNGMDSPVLSIPWSLELNRYGRQTNENRRKQKKEILKGFIELLLEQLHGEFSTPDFSRHSSI